MSKGEESSLVLAARRLAENLCRFEALSSELGQKRIDSDKALQRAKQGLLACAEHEAELAESLRAFAAAMQSVQTTQHRCMDLTASAAQQIQARQEQRSKLEERLTQLGERAREVSAPVAALSDSVESPSAAMFGSLEEVERRLDAMLQDASEVCALAKQDDWADVERDTRALEQQLHALRNRVQLFRRKLSKQAPS